MLYLFAGVPHEKKRKQGYDFALLFVFVCVTMFASKKKVKRSTSKARKKKEEKYKSRQRKLDDLANRRRMTKLRQHKVASNNTIKKSKHVKAKMYTKYSVNKMRKSYNKIIADLETDNQNLHQKIEELQNEKRDLLYQLIDTQFFELFIEKFNKFILSQIETDSVIIEAGYV